MTENIDIPVESTGEQAASIDESTPIQEQESAPVEQVTETQQEKMIPQSQVSRIAAREAREAADRARQETIAEYERRTQEANREQASSIGGIQQQSPDQIRDMIRQEAMMMSRQAQAQQIESDFKSKIAAERMADPDFADSYDALNIEAHPELVIWANGLDNTAQIIKDLANNPAKYSNILMLAKSGAPMLAQKELQKLSQSIKANLAAQKQPKAPDPLSQIKPSSIGVDNGSMEVSDYRNQDWLRG
jgi:hypothetical protein